jgi:hypothetical protein
MMKSYPPDQPAPNDAPTVGTDALLLKILDEEKQQTKYLKTVHIVLVIFEILVAIYLFFTACSAFL